MVGGISRTVLRDGWRFDLGGHRFFTKVDEVEEPLRHEILPAEDFLLRPRMSRIFYRGKYYDYPLKATNALRNLGLWEAMLCGFSYVWARIRPPKTSNYEGWLVARFGWRLTDIFSRPIRRRCGESRSPRCPPMGRPESQEPGSSQSGDECHLAEARPEGDHEPH